MITYFKDENKIRREKNYETLSTILESSDTNAIIAIITTSVTLSFEGLVLQ